MTKAIEVKYLGATNTKPARIVAFAEGGNRLTISRCGDLVDSQWAAFAASELAKRLDWHGVWVSGYLPNRNTVFVNLDPRRRAAFGAEFFAYLATLELGAWFEVLPTERGKS